MLLLFTFVLNSPTMTHKCYLRDPILVYVIGDRCVCANANGALTKVQLWIRLLYETMTQMSHPLIDLSTNENHHAYNKVGFFCI